MTVTVLYAGEDFPETLDASLYLCGPTPALRADDWRLKALDVVNDLWWRQAGRGELVVLYPEPRTGELSFEEHVTWEEQALSMADIVAFYIPRSMPEMPALITNVKFGRLVDSGRIVLGYPAHAERNEYLRYLADASSVPVRNTLLDTLTAALDMVGGGYPRVGPLTRIPASVASDPRLNVLLQAGGSSMLRKCVCHFTRRAYNPGEPPDWQVEMHWSSTDGDESRIVGTALLGDRSEIRAS